MPTTVTETNTTTPADESQQILSWVKSAQSGNRVSFERLADKYYAAIFRMAFYRTKNRMDAEDITQDVFIKAYQGLGGLTDATRFKGWLFQIAANRVRDFLRRKKFKGLFKSLSDGSNDRHPEQFESTRPGPYELLRRQRFHQETENFLGRLTKIEKDVFMLRFIDQLQLSEIATALQRSESTVKTHLYRALAKFKHDHTFREYLKGAVS